MRYLLDTHSLIWWWNDDPRLSLAAREAIAEPDNEIWVSAVSAWEIATKARIGKLTDMPDAVARYPVLITRNRFRALAIDAGHALRAGQYPQLHRDPFDRLLAAQAEIEKMPLITRDQELASFGCDVYW
jgi:PIN domain nuclease of toxin-antitoxin system